MINKQKSLDGVSGKSLKRTLKTGATLWPRNKDVMSGARVAMLCSQRDP